MLQLCSLRNYFMLPMDFTCFIESKFAIRLAGHSIFEHLILMINFYFHPEFVFAHFLIFIILLLKPFKIFDF